MAQKLAIKDARDAAKEFSEDYDVDLKGLYSASLSPLNVQSQPYMRAEKVIHRVGQQAPHNAKLNPARITQ